MQSGKSVQEAEKILSGTPPGVKHELLFKQFGINYTKHIAPKFRRGSLIVRSSQRNEEEQVNKEEKVNESGELVLMHEDLVRDDFWQKHGRLLLQEEAKKK